VSIAVLCPTRNRPDNVARLAASAWEHAADPDSVELVFYEDEDAPGSVPDSLAAFDGVRVVRGPRIVLSDMWNRCAAAAAADILMQCGDDIVFATPGWDKLVTGAIESYPDRIVLAYGRDGTPIHGDDFGSHGFVHRRWTDTLGYFTPPYFSSDYGDTWLNDLAARIGRKHFIPGLLTDHLHPAAGRAEWDQNHRERLERHAQDDVAAIWERTGPERKRDAAKLRAVLGTPA
jgi:hypothetical protein